MSATFGRSPSALLLAGLLVAGAAAAQGTVVVDFPDPANLLLNTTFVLDEDVLYVPTYDDGHVLPRLWSVSSTSGALLDPDGLPLPAPGLATDPELFAGDLLAMPGWYPGQAVIVVDVADPRDLRIAGTIGLPANTNIQGQDLLVAPDGRTGYVASFVDDTLYSFDVVSRTLLDPDGVALPGNPDRIALVGDRVAIGDTTNGRILVVDVSAPAQLAYVGAIPLPFGPTFTSHSDFAVADDGRTAFVCSFQGVLYSLDVVALSLPDPDGLSFPPPYTGGGAGVARNGTTLAFDAGGLHFVDASDPSNLTLISHGHAGPTPEAVTTGGGVFTPDGTRFVSRSWWPSHEVHVYDVASGARTTTWPTGSQPAFLGIHGPDDRVIVSCADSDHVELVHGLLGAPLPRAYCDAKATAAGCLPAIAWSGLPSATDPAPFEVETRSVRLGQAGMLFYGATGADRPFMGGRLCVEPPIRRTPVRFPEPVGGPPGCDGRLSIDFNAWIQGGPDGSLAPGVVRYLQWWFRDPQDPAGVGLSDAVQVVIGP